MQERAQLWHTRICHLSASPTVQVADCSTQVTGKVVAAWISGKVGSHRLSAKGLVGRTSGKLAGRDPHARVPGALPAARHSWPRAAQPREAWSQGAGDHQGGPHQANSSGSGRPKEALAVSHSIGSAWLSRRKALRGTSFRSQQTKVIRVGSNEAISDRPSCQNTGTIEDRMRTQCRRGLTTI